MARPSVKEERAAAILAAFERCVARYGVEGATLERISQESGLHRSLLRHHVGNREALLERLLERCVGTEQDDIQRLFDDLHSGDSSVERNEELIIAYLFGEMPEQEQLRMRVALALLAAVENYPSIKRRLSQWNNDFIANLQRLLQQAYPKFQAEQCAAVAWGLASISLSHLSMAPLGSVKLYQRSGVQAAKILLQSLRG
ncbi:TetR/AcrR family transcriptional regulator [uncultured Pseudoteredinibacter sp.]|uniref:TetR/AcrR family transcriptional regulator n=1 Tax=uncultured Pseudoteredinibacter sp. TaxID=1641701 RepID=UPI002636C0BE|nr:TetR/AcrR family transcriptional regulator [uncultured Pseudoteredinibacter sp.]